MFGAARIYNRLPMTVPVHISDDEADYGPAMLACSERQRRYVEIMVAHPEAAQAAAARRAGYGLPDTNHNTMKQIGFKVAHNPKVIEAIREVASQRLNTSTLLAASVLAKIAASPTAQDKDKIKAALGLLDRTGFGAQQNINVTKTVTRKIDVSAAADKIAEFRRKFPEQFAKLIGGETVAAPAVIDGEFTEVGANK